MPFNIRKLLLSLVRLFWGEQTRVVQSLSCVQLFATPWTAAHQASLSVTNSQILLKLMTNHLQAHSFTEEGRCLLEDGWDLGAQVCVGGESRLLHGISTRDSKQHPHS